MSEGECEPLTSTQVVATQATTLLEQVGDFSYTPPRVDSNATFQHLVMYFIARSVTT